MGEIEKVTGRLGNQSRWKSLKEKQMQKERLKDIADDEHKWLQCNTDPKNTAAIFNLQEKMVKTIRWKKMRSMMD